MHRRNIRFHVSYDGTRYLGWQRLGGNQKDLSIQGLIEGVLSNLLNENIKIMGSGRTDAGVHAFAQVANFYTHTNDSIHELTKKLGDSMPEDIVIYNIEEVPEDFHSRFSAVGKVYEYYIDNVERENVFTRKYAYHVEKKLDIEKMREAASYLVGTHDFYSFSTDRGKDDTVRTLYAIDIEETPFSLGSADESRDEKQALLRIRLHGDGFLYNMVRIIVGTLLEVGAGERKIDSIQIAIDNKKRDLAGITVPPQGLFLKSVEYKF
ncbi:tRNA pseudouridine(38-40) synthase TruA [Anaerosporobacter sp.]|uniref:tRNA pseudouridine(38-40) synthase TruA n=1 Tax=Anaerosporobacter sp. TaxID=1872529 RepID=UPI00286ED3F7|nr:tRNA pseudouridine(38-40) synthase TruA [Anaerosporobacter sp.]